MINFWKWFLSLISWFRPKEHESPEDVHPLQRKLNTIVDKAKRYKAQLQNKPVDIRTNRDKLIDYLYPGYSYYGWHRRSNKRERLFK